MQVDPDARTARLSVGELAAFDTAPSATGDGGPWRTEIGRRWHTVSAEETAAEYGGDRAEFERTVAGVRAASGWSVHLQGRIDQVIRDGAGRRLREVKTIRGSLPAPDEDLAARYPAYFAQAAIYRRLLADEIPDCAVTAAVLFIDIDSGMRQEVPLTGSPDALIESPLERLLQFLEDRRRSRVRLSSLRVRPPFETPRPGQAEAEATVDRLLQPGGTVLLEAPTGFGKTGMVLHLAIQRLAGGTVDRVVYVTGKSTGQLEVVRQVRAIGGDSVRFIQMRNRAEHAISGPMHTCTGDERCNEDVTERWQAAGLHPPELLAGGTLDLEAARAAGHATGVCPYAVTRACLPFAEVWIGDFNYLFAPGSRAVFAGQPGFDPGRTLLIVDEAHNLPDRAADALSLAVGAGEAGSTAAELASATRSRPLKAVAAEWARAVGDLPEGALAAGARYALIDIAEDFARQLAAARVEWDALGREACAQLWRTPAIAAALAEDDDSRVVWAPRPGVLEIACIDAAGWIRECIEPFDTRLLMSATLDPFSPFAASCGLDPARCRTVAADAPWRAGTLDAAIDLRVDTRLRARRESGGAVAESVAAMDASPGNGPVVVFFPSFRYAADIAAYLGVLAPALRCVTQPRGVDLRRQAAFIESALRDADVILLVLGSSYAEAVDHLGGRVERAVIVGPALPEPGFLRRERERRAGGDAAFDAVYRVPAMRKVRQALGRLVRGPGQRARVLFLDPRFAEPGYRRLLEHDVPDPVLVRSRDQLLDWIARG